MTTFVLPRDTLFSNPILAVPSKWVAGLITGMVVAQGKALQDERTKTLRRLDLKKEQFPVSYGWCI
ncbi:hypothetical protein [Telmatospirillum sp.]|uniref:hypothetical protein n=1 Tax=Telmatospirillum sp. TaxID=2079197 RepID=UPI0028449AAE|nr:hypothetical protein [Telmatospirillum sp.]MDR3435055.1 hypothetical protein [Telmatospirillum sp.]